MMPCGKCKHLLKPVLRGVCYTCYDPLDPETEYKNFEAGDWYAEDLKEQGAKNEKRSVS